MFEKYFNEVSENASNDFLSFDGAFEFSNDGYGFSDYNNADGIGGTLSAPTSQPYIVNVQNTNTTSAISKCYEKHVSFIRTSQINDARI